jgi:pimeloyl-ACP methyl ester carboxylesterase
MESLTIHLDDIALPAFAHGEGELLVFLHGAPGDRRTWLAVMEALPPGLRAVSYTQRWFGAEPRDHGAAPFGTRALADDLLAVLDRLGGGPAHVVAWSFSAHAALAAALARPQAFRSLFLYELGFPTFVTDAADRAAIAAWGEATFGPVAAALARDDLEAAVACAIDAAAGAPGHFERQPEALRRIHAQNAHVLPRLFRQTPPVPISSADLAGLQPATTIAWGASTPVAYRLVGRAAARAAPQARALEIPGAGHLWPEVDPHAFAACVAEAAGRAG